MSLYYFMRLNLDSRPEIGSMTHIPVIMSFVQSERETASKDLP